MLEEKIQFEKLSRKQIEKRLEELCRERKGNDGDVSKLREVLDNLSNSPKRAYGVIATFLDDQKGPYMFLHDLEKLVTNAPFEVYDFLIERAGEARCSFQIEYASKAMDMLMQSQGTRRIVYRLLGGERRKDVPIHDVLEKIRELFKDGWLKKQSPSEKNHYLGPEDHLHGIVRNTHELYDFSEELIDFVGSNMRNWFPMNLNFGIITLSESKGMNSESICILKKLFQKEPEYMQVFCRALVPVDGSKKLYDHLDKWSNGTGREWHWQALTLQYLPNWLVYHQPRWIRKLKGPLWAYSCQGHPQKPQRMRNAFYYFFHGKMKKASIDDILAIVDERITNYNWNFDAFHWLSYHLAEVSDYPCVWDFVRTEARTNRLKLPHEMHPLTNTAYIVAACQEARNALYRSSKGVEREGVSVDDVIGLLRNKKWSDSKVRQVLNPYSNFFEKKLADAVFLVSRSQKRGIPETEINEVGEALRWLKKPKKEFYELMDGLPAKRVRSLVDAYNSLTYISEEKRMDVMRYARKRGQLAENMHELTMVKKYRKFRRWRSALSYFQDIEIGRFTRLISKVNPLFDTLHAIGKSDKLFALQIDENASVENNCQCYEYKLDALTEKYEDLIGSQERAGKRRRVYNALKVFDEEKKLAICSYLRKNRQFLNLADFNRQNKQVASLLDRLAYFQSTETKKLVPFLARVQTVDRVLVAAQKPERLYNTQLRYTGDPIQDMNTVLEALDEIVFSLIDDMVGEHVDRAKLSVNDELLTILEGHYTTKSDVAKKLYVNYLNGKTTLSLEEIAKMTRLKLVEETKPLITHVISQYEQGIVVPKAFPIGKEYFRQAVHGLKERTNPIQMTELLIYGLISRQDGKVREAGNKFDHELLQKARSCIRPEATYGRIRQDLGMVCRGDGQSAKRILETLRMMYGNVEPVMDLVDGVSGLFTGQEYFDYIACRMQDSNVFDILGSDRLACCTFQPTNSQASLLYLLDPFLGLLHLAPIAAGKYLDPISAGIMAKCKDEHGNRILLVDSVEGGFEVDRLRESAWKGMMYDGIGGVAGDVGVDAIAFNLRTAAVKAKKFNNYVKEKTGQEPVKVFLEKMGGQNPYGLKNTGLEAFGSGNIYGEVKCILVK